MDYTYSIQNDFPNQQVDIATLVDEIEQSELDIPLKHLTMSDSGCTLSFSIELTVNQKGILDDVVAVHSGEMIQESEEISYVKIAELEKYTPNQKSKFQALMVDMDIPTGSGKTIKDFSFPYQIHLFSAEWTEISEYKNDIAAFHFAPDTVIGVLMVNANSGDTVLTVSPTVLENAQYGYNVKIGNKDYGRILSLNSDNSTITLETPLDQNYTAGVTLIKITYQLVPYYRFSGAGTISVGKSKIGAQPIPANTIMRIIYDNVNGLEKKFGILIEYLF